MTNEHLTQPLFVRNSSGFVREFNVWDVFVFNLLGYATGLSLATNPTVLGSLYPGAAIKPVLLFGLLASLFCGLNYGLFGAAFPRSGGDYIFISRTLHPALGFVANWGFTWSQIFGIGIFSGWAVRDSLSPAIATYGYLVGSSRLVTLGNTLAQPDSIALLASLLLGVSVLLSLAGLRFLKYIFTLLFLIGLAGVAIMIYLFATTDHATFVTKFNAFMSKSASLPDAYATILQMASEAGLATGPPSLISAFLALPVGFLIFFGFTYSVYVGGEVREPQKSQSRGILGALVFGFIISWLGMGWYYDVVGRDFNNAVAVVKELPTSPLPVGGSMVFFAGILTSSRLLSAIINAGAFIWFFLLPIIMLQICVRNVFAWSFDRLVPAGLARVSKRSRSPWLATLAVGGVAEIVMLLDQWIGLPYINYMALFSVCFFFAGIAGLVFPYRRADLFKLTPPVVQAKIGNIPLISIAGLGTAVLFAVIVYSSITNRSLSGVAAGHIPLFVLIGVYGAGCAVYAWQRLRRRPDRIDPRKLYEVIPPE